MKILKIEKGTTKGGKPYEKWQVEERPGVTINMNVFDPEIIGQFREGEDNLDIKYEGKQVGNTVYYNVTGVIRKSGAPMKATFGTLPGQSVEPPKKVQFVTESEDQQEAIFKSVAQKNAVEFIKALTPEERAEVFKGMNPLQALLGISDSLYKWFKKEL